MEEDTCLFLQICNSIESEVLGLITHYEFVKELMDYLEFVFYGKGNICRIFDVCLLSSKEARLVSHGIFYIDYKKT